MERECPHDGSTAFFLGLVMDVYQGECDENRAKHCLDNNWINQEQYKQLMEIIPDKKESSGAPTALILALTFLCSTLVHSCMKKEEPKKIYQDQLDISDHSDRYFYWENLKQFRHTRGLWKTLIAESPAEYPSKSQSDALEGDYPARNVSPLSEETSIKNNKLPSKLPHPLEDQDSLL